MTCGVSDIGDIRNKKFSSKKFLANSNFPQFPIISFETRTILVTLNDTPVRDSQERPP